MAGGLRSYGRRGASASELLVYRSRHESRVSEAISGPCKPCGSRAGRAGPPHSDRQRAAHEPTVHCTGRPSSPSCRDTRSGADASQRHRRSRSLASQVMWRYRICATCAGRRPRWTPPAALLSATPSPFVACGWGPPTTLQFAAAPWPRQKGVLYDFRQTSARRLSVPAIARAWF